MSNVLMLACQQSQHQPMSKLMLVKLDTICTLSLSATFWPR